MGAPAFHLLYQYQDVHGDETRDDALDLTIAIAGFPRDEADARIDTLTKMIGMIGQGQEHKALSVW